MPTTAAGPRGTALLLLAMMAASCCLAAAGVPAAHYYYSPRPVPLKKAHDTPGYYYGRPRVPVQGLPTPAPHQVPLPSKQFGSPPPSPTPSPTTVQQASITPAATICIPSGLPVPPTGIRANMISVGEFGGKAQAVSNLLADLLGIPCDHISTEEDTDEAAEEAPITPSPTSDAGMEGNARRRLHTATDLTPVTATIPSATPAATASNLRLAADSGVLATDLATLELSLLANSLTITTYGNTALLAASDAPAPAPSALEDGSTPQLTATLAGASAPSPAPAPAPAPATAAPLKKKQSSKTGAIVGGVLGSIGAVAIAAAGWYFLKKRKAAAGAIMTSAPTFEAAASPAAGVTATLATGGLKVKTRVGELAEDTGYSSSPRNTVTPRTRAGNMA